MHRGPEGVVIFTADKSISVALHVCWSLSPLIAIVSMMVSGNNSTLREKPRFLASSTALRGIAELSEPVSASTVTLTPRYSGEILGLVIPVVSRRSVVAQSFEVRLLRVGVSLLLVL
jgi:hypothetical protein